MSTRLSLNQSALGTTPLLGRYTWGLCLLAVFPSFTSISRRTDPASAPRDRQVAGPDLDTYLDDATSFIAAHIRRGCVLVHCGAGKSRSVAVVIAYLCRYAGMSYAKRLLSSLNVGQELARLRASPKRSSGGCGSMSWRQKGPRR